METKRLLIGDSVVCAPEDLFRLAGFKTYSNSADPLDESHGAPALTAVAIALSEGLRDEAVLLRAIAIREERKAAQAQIDHQRASDDAALHVARINRQTARINARLAGINTDCF